jgi:hypothetical protein
MHHVKGPRNYLNITIQEKYKAVKAIGNGKNVNDILPPIYRAHGVQIPGNLLGVYYSWRYQLVNLFFDHPRKFFALR